MIKYRNYTEVTSRAEEAIVVAGLGVGLLCFKIKVVFVRLNRCGREENEMKRRGGK